MIAANVLFQVTLMSLFWSATADKQLCPKILFQNINIDQMPWVQVSGVYELFSTNEGFPVYLNKASSLFFYYSHETTRATNLKTLTFGYKIGNVFGVIGLLPADFDPKTWLGAGSLNTKDIFGDVVNAWEYFSPLERTFKAISDKPKAICVDDDVKECDSGKVYLNEVIIGSDSVILNDPKLDYFSTLHGTYSEIRPVYKHNKQNWYLYYNSGYWKIGTSYTGRFRNDLLRVNDGVLRPEFVTGRWEKRDGLSWVYISSDVKILCRGISNGADSCNGRYTCNDGSCIYTKGNETVCACTGDTYGPHCEKKQRCPSPGIPSSGVEVAWRGTRPGDIATLFCKAGYTSIPMEYYVCEGTEWLRESIASCRDQVPTTSSSTRAVKTTHTVDPEPHPTDKPWNKSLDFLIFFGPCLAFQLVVPCFIWLGLIITDMVRACRKTTSGTPERTEAIGSIQKEKHTKLLRVYSAFLNLAFWIWLGFVCACAASSRLRHVHENLFYCAIAMCFFCVIFVALEALFCRERRALQNIVTWDYIKYLQTIPPLVEMNIERFDWKEVQASGWHTNPTTGNLEYRHSIHRKVGKIVVCEPFVFDSWNDISSQENCFESNITLLHLKAKITLEGDATKVSFEQQKEALVHKTDQMRRSYSFSRKDSVPTLRRFVLLCSNTRDVPSWMSENYFWYATLLQFSWVYRWCLASKLNFSEYILRKNLFANPQNDNQPEDDGKGTNGTTAISSAQTPVLASTPLMDGQKHRNYEAV